MPLLTVQDVAKATGRTITSPSALYDQVQFFCDVVESYIAIIVGYTFSVADHTIRLQADYDGIITLPKKPVNSVSTIKTINDLTVTGWEWDGIDEIDGLESHQVVDVTFNAGFSDPPEDLKNLAISVASRQTVNPDGIRQKTVGAISETFAAGDGSAGSVFFTGMERMILDNYLTKMDTWRLGPRTNQSRFSHLPIL